MQRRLLSVILCLIFLASVLVGCGSDETGGDTTKTPSTKETEEAKKSEQPKASASTSGEKLKVGVAMPTQSSERWINDGKNMKEKLEALGYEVDMQYAEDDVQMQVSQIENLIANGANCLVIAAVDSSALVNVRLFVKSWGKSDYRTQERFSCVLF